MGGAAADAIQTIPFHEREGVNQETAIITVMRSFVTLSTAVLLCLIYRRYQLRIEILKLKE